MVTSAEGFFHEPGPSAGCTRFAKIILVSVGVFRQPGSPTGCCRANRRWRSACVRRRPIAWDPSVYPPTSFNNECSLSTRQIKGKHSWLRSRPAATHRGGGEGPPGLTRPRILGEGLLSVMSESPLDGPSKVSFRTEPGPRARARVKDRVRPKDRALNPADRAQSSDRVGPQHDHLLIGQPPREFPPAESASGIRPRPPPPQHCRKP